MPLNLSDKNVHKKGVVHVVLIKASEYFSFKRGVFSSPACPFLYMSNYQRVEAMSKVCWLTDSGGMSQNILNSTS